jgi:hypothetical protein
MAPSARSDAFWASMPQAQLLREDAAVDLVLFEGLELLLVQLLALHGRPLVECLSRYLLAHTQVIY